jgi:hypothetical protein
MRVEAAVNWFLNAVPHASEIIKATANRHSDLAPYT